MNYTAKQLRKGMVVNLEWVGLPYNLYHDPFCTGTFGRVQHELDREEWPHGLPGLHEVEVVRRVGNDVYISINDFGDVEKFTQLSCGRFFREGFCGYWVISKIPPPLPKLTKGHEWYLIAHNLWPNGFRWKQGRKLLRVIGGGVNNFGYCMMLNRLRDTNRIAKVSRGHYAWKEDAQPFPPPNIWGTHRRTFRTRKFL